MESYPNIQEELKQEDPENNFQIEDLSSNHKYRTEIPNIILDMGLTPYEGWFYTHLKRIAADKGKSYASNKYLAKLTGCCATKIKETKKSLIKKNLIRATPRKKADGSFLPTLIEIIDWWPANYKHFSSKAEKSEGVGRHTTEVGRHTTEVGRHTTVKKELYKKEPYKKKQVAHKDATLLSKYLFEKLKKIRANRKQPSWDSWEKSFDRIMKKNRCSKEDILKMIDWIFDEQEMFRVESPSSLLKKYDNIADHMVKSKKKRKKSFSERCKEDPLFNKT